MALLLFMQLTTMSLLFGALESMYRANMRSRVAITPVNKHDIGYSLPVVKCNMKNTHPQN